MAVSKRTRFEVLRRDSHACQYCGQMAPDVVLHVDHVIPVALGGSDKPDNLLTACKECNSGKSSIAPDSPIVEALGAKAAAYALGMTEKMTRLRATVEQADEYVVEFEDLWEGYGWRGKPMPLPVDYESSLHRWFEMGIPIRVVELAIKRAVALQYPKGDYAHFSYMAGVIWTKINQAEIDYSLTEDTVAVYTEFEADEMRIEGYQEGLVVGRRRGHEEAEKVERAFDFVAHHIDGTSSAVTRGMRVAA